MNLQPQRIVIQFVVHPRCLHAELQKYFSVRVAHAHGERLRMAQVFRQDIR